MAVGCEPDRTHLKAPSPSISKSLWDGMIFAKVIVWKAQDIALFDCLWIEYHLETHLVNYVLGACRWPPDIGWSEKPQGHFAIRERMTTLKLPPIARPQRGTAQKGDKLCKTSWFFFEKSNGDIMAKSCAQTSSGRGTLRDSTTPVVLAQALCTNEWWIIFWMAPGVSDAALSVLLTIFPPKGLSQSSFFLILFVART